MQLSLGAVLAGLSPFYVWLVAQTLRDTREVSPGEPERWPGRAVVKGWSGMVPDPG